MKYYIYLSALCLLLAVASPSAHASESSVDLPVATSFPVSGVAKAMDNASGVFTPGPGKIDIARGNDGLYIRVPGPVSNGTRLTSLNDYENGIVFRNNTLLLPLYPAGENTAALIIATDDLTADSNGFVGMITGLEVDGGKITAARDGRNFTAATIISLTDLPAGATYRVAFADNSSLSAAVSADLETSGLVAAVASPPLAVSATTPAAGNAISFVIVTLETEMNWAGPYGDDNITFYRFAGGRLSRLRYSIVKSSDGGLLYQAIAPGAGQFQVVAGAPREQVPETVTASNSEIALFGSLLAGLLIALAAMVRRVTKR